MTADEFRAAYTELMERKPWDDASYSSCRRVSPGHYDLAYLRDNGDWVEEWFLSKRDLWGLLWVLVKGLLGGKL